MQRSRANADGRDFPTKASVMHTRIHLNGVRALSRNGREQLRLLELHLLALETAPCDMEEIGAVVRALGNLRRAAHRLKLRDLYYCAEEQERRVREALEGGLLPETHIDSCLHMIEVLKRYLAHVEESLRTGEPLPLPRMLPSLRRSVESRGEPRRSAPAITSRDAHKRLGELLMESGDISEGELQRALFELEETGAAKPLGELLLEELQISREQLNRALAEQKSAAQPTRLGRVLVNMGAISPQGLARGLEKQHHPKEPRLGERLVRTGRVPAKRVVLALRCQGMIRDSVRHGLATLAARLAVRATEMGPPRQRERLSHDEREALARFRDEARNLLNAADRGLLALEPDPVDRQALTSVRRSIYALSRFARYLGLADIGHFAQAFSGYLARAAGNMFVLEGPRLDVAFDCIEVLRRHVDYVDDALETKGRIRRERQLPAYIAVLRRLSVGGQKDLQINRLQPSEPGQRLGDILMASGAITHEALEAALAAQARAQKSARLGELLVDEALISRDQVDAALAAQQQDLSIGRLGDVLVQWGLLDRADIDAAIARRQARGRPRLGELLVRMGAVRAKAAAHALRRQRARLAGAAAAALVATSILVPAPPASAASTALSQGDSAIVRALSERLEAAPERDRLSGAVEAARGARPLALDIDRDGMLDGWEVWSALHPGPVAGTDNALHRGSPTSGDVSAPASQQGPGLLTEDEAWDYVEWQQSTDLAPAERRPMPRARGGLFFSELQYVINAALGLDTPVPPDLNRAGAADAPDILEIIHTALGIAPPA